MSYLKDEKRFDPLHSPGGKALAHWAEEHLKPNLNILEVGCGSGSLSCYLAMLGAEVTGLDIDPVAVQIALQNRDLTGVKVQFKVSNIFSALRREKYDFILFHPPIKRGFPENIPSYRNLAGPNFEYFSIFWRRVNHHLVGPKLVASSVQVPRVTLAMAEEAGWDLLTTGPPAWFTKRILKP